MLHLGSLGPLLVDMIVSSSEKFSLAVLPRGVRWHDKNWLVVAHYALGLNFVWGSAASAYLLKLRLDVLHQI